MIKRISLALIILVILFLGAIFILPGLVPTDSYRDKLESELSKTFARDVTVSGDIKLSTFPVIKVETGPVSLSNPKGFSENNFVDVQGMSAKVKLWPLLRKQVEISGVNLNTPTISLERQSNGEVNWSLNDGSDVIVEPKESGPFKRDGRYTEYDPSLALLQISDGTVIYSDKQTGQNLTAEKINLDLRIPNLRSTLKLKGDLIIDDLPTKLDVALKSPFDFLSGNTASFEALLETDEGKVDASGSFLKSEDIAFEATFTGGSNAPLSLAKRLPLPEDLSLPPLSDVASKGTLLFSPSQKALPNVEVSANGQGLNASFTGKVDFSDELSGAGDFTTSVTNMSLLKPYLKEPIDALDHIQNFEAEGTLNLQGSDIQVSGLSTQISGQYIEGRFTGNLRFDETLSSAGSFSARLNDMSLVQPYLEKPIQAFDLIQSLKASGDLNLNGSNIRVTGLNSQILGPQVDAAFAGDLSFEETLSLNGEFSGKTSDVVQLVETAGLDQPDAAALKALSGTGNVNLSGDIITLTNLVAKAEEGFVNGDFTGRATYSDRLNLEGAFNGNIRDLRALDAALSRDIPYSDVAKKITLSTQIASTANGVSLSDTTAKLEDGLLNGNFAGQLAIGDDSDISGSLFLTASSLRDIAKTQNVAVPPSTEVGPIFEGFQLSGQVSGTPEVINFNNGSLTLDNIETTGDFVLHMTGAKPRISGALEMNTLDLRPYMAAWSEQKPEGIILPWSTTPINLGGLEAVDAEIDLNITSIIMDRLNLGTTKAQASLKNGFLSTNISKAQLYDGLVDGALSLTNNNGVPKVSINAEVNSVAAQTFLSASSGFDKVLGTANLSLSLEGQGISQEAIMKSLTGTGSFKIRDGQLLGVDAAALVSGIDEALTSRSIPQGIGLGKTTDFNDLVGSFSITNGRANLGNFKLQSGSLFMDAGGLIDIGGQRLDFGIRPKLSEGSDLAQFGIPLKFSGGFGEATAGLDTDVLAQIAAAKARQSAGDLVKENVGGTFGNILGGVIGGNQESPNDAPEESTLPSETGSERPNISDLLNLPKTPQEENTTGSEPTNSVSESVSEEPTEPEKVEPEALNPEEQIENALKGLFGRKKEKDRAE